MNSQILKVKLKDLATKHLNKSNSKVKIYLTCVLQNNLCPKNNYIHKLSK